ncbi:DUF4330 family protein [Halovenus rubra]|uniref:DUF4330 family protein n=2 Tax=Halovenus rubra TaxID=869890 RepID=A0ABD5X8T0_9EURY|nr:DUF4330 family protein [Halovenus rubra]
MTDSEEDSPRLLDEDGRLFGLVNIVDVLVVLLVLAVVVAGVVLLFPSGSGKTDTRYVTLDLGDQPNYLAEAISPGDEWTPDRTSDSVTITDVYRVNNGTGTNVLARAAVNGTQVEPEGPAEEPIFEFRGNPLRTGQTFNIVTSEYEVEGAVTRVETDGETLSVTNSEIVLETNLTSATASEIDVGDQFTAGGTTFAQVRSLELFPETEGSNAQYALVGVTARTIERDGAQHLGDTRVAVGQSLTFGGNGYSFGAEIIEHGTSNLTTESRQLVVQKEVPTTVANDIAVGDQFNVNSNPVVTVSSVTVYPTASPDTRRVVLGVSAKVRTTGEEILFGDRQLRVGSQLPIQTDNYNIQTEIIRRGSSDEPGSPTTQAVTVQLKNIPPERANSLTAGMTEESRDRTTAEVQNVTTQPAEVILESESGEIFLREHPQNKDVELTVDLSVRELEDGTVRFRGETLRVGQALSLELGPLTINSKVIGFEE